MAFQFIKSPTGEAIDNTSLVTSALDQPMSIGSTFWDQAKGGVLESFGLGTAVRSLTTPEAAPVEGGGAIADTLGAINRAIAPDAIARRIIGSAYDGSAVMTEDQYKRSTSFRKDIPWQPGMTEERAASLAEQDDIKQVRSFYGQKRPVTAFFGNLAGQAIDPINYIPIAGEAVAAANTARFGKIAGRAITSALDAAGNTALAGLGTAPVRAEFGDDVSWQATLSQVAMAAMIGGAFGALHGRFGRDTPTELRTEAADKLATLDNVQTSRVALNDAIDGMIRDGEVSMSPASAEFVARAADTELPKVVISRAARDSDPEAFRRLDVLNKTFDINEAEIKRLQAITLDSETYGPTRAAMMEANDLADRLDKAEQAIAAAPSEKEKTAATGRRDTIRQQLKERLAGIDDEKVQQIEDVEQQLSQRRAAHEPVIAERQQLKRKTDELFAAARDEYWQNRFAEPATQKNAEALSEVKAPDVSVASTNAPRARQLASVDTGIPPVPPEPAVAEAIKRVGKPEGSKALAEQYRVNPETGDFPELADIDQLRAEGRLTEDDIAALDDADETIKTANAYGEALKSFASCVI